MTMDHATEASAVGTEPLAAGPLTIDERAERRGWRRPGLTTTLNIVRR